MKSNTSNKNNAKAQAPSKKVCTHYLVWVEFSGLNFLQSQRIEGQNLTSQPGPVKGTPHSLSVVFLRAHIPSIANLSKARNKKVEAEAAVPHAAPECNCSTQRQIDIRDRVVTDFMYHIDEQRRLLKWKQELFRTVRLIISGATA